MKSRKVSKTGNNRIPKTMIRPFPLLRVVGVSNPVVTVWMPNTASKNPINRDPVSPIKIFLFMEKLNLRNAISVAIVAKLIVK